MPFGPGRYDAQCTIIREQTGAAGVALIVIGGVHGSGFSVQAPGDVTLVLPELLEEMAREIRRQFEQGQL